MRSVPILIVGGGAAGMMAAAAVSGCGKKALIIEKMNQLGKKILATGNGRCNYTNLRQKPEFYHVDETDGVWEILKRFDEKQAISFFKDAGVYPRERDGYVYPMSLQAVSLQELPAEKNR